MADEETELKCTVMARLSLERLFKFPFVLKLWVMTNDPQVKILQWNTDHSAVIVNLSGMRDYLQSSRVSLFACRHLDDFLWLMEHAGFVEWSTLVKPDDTYGPDHVHKLYRHRMFVYANNVVFERWLLDGLAHESIDGNIHLDCGFPLGPNFYGSRRLMGQSEFEEVKASISYEMLQLQTLIENECNAKRECNDDGGAGSADAGDVIEVEVPPQYIDVPAMEERTGASDTVAGNYGPVSTEALLRCLGEMRPVYVNELTDEVKIENGASAEDGISWKMEADTGGDGGSWALEHQAGDVKIEDSYDSGTPEHDSGPSVAKRRSLCLDVSSSGRLTECVLNIINPPKTD